MKLEIDYTKLKKAGYTKHRTKGRGWIKPVGKSRFHALSRDGMYELHFDKTRNKIHYSKGFDDIVRGEGRRILRTND